MQRHREPVVAALLPQLLGERSGVRTAGREGLVAVALVGDPFRLVGGGSTVVAWPVAVRRTPGRDHKRVPAVEGDSDIVAGAEAAGGRIAFLPLRVLGALRNLLAPSMSKGAAPVRHNAGLRCDVGRCQIAVYLRIPSGCDLWETLGEAATGCWRSRHGRGTVVRRSDGAAAHHRLELQSALRRVRREPLKHEGLLIGFPGAARLGCS